MERNEQMQFIIQVNYFSLPAAAATNYLYNQKQTRILSKIIHQHDDSQQFTIKTNEEVAIFTSYPSLEMRIVKES
ncbi:hypothetical protein [Peribacillus sp. SCS-155]|uniref:hypothetical protein n=1 Tax=Peribacillus sedimenti TaxID=3115297 RepID=UPI0039059746